MYFAVGKGGLSSGDAWVVLATLFVASGVIVVFIVSAILRVQFVSSRSFARACCPYTIECSSHRKSEFISPPRTICLPIDLNVVETRGAVVVA